MAVPPEIVAKLNECAQHDSTHLRGIWFMVLVVFTVLVGLGLILEVFELWHEILSVLRERNERFKYRIVLSEKRLEIYKVVAFVGWMLIVAGVLGEGYSEVRIHVLSTVIDECSNARMVELQYEAGDAAKSAQIAHDEADAVKIEADELTGRLANAARQLGILEQDTRVQGPRWKLLEAGKDVFVRELRPFAGQKVTVISCGHISPPEQYKLEQLILNLLSIGKDSANWIMGSPGYTPWSRCVNGATAVGGNLVTFSSNADDAVKEAAKALSDVLNKLEISTINTPSFPSNTNVILEGFDSPWVIAAKDPTQVFILIGPNPMFDLAGWKKQKETRPK
jgi:hypothetical protein